MRRNTSIRDRARSWGAIVCLVSYLLGAAPLAAEIALLIAYLDGSHGLVLKTGERKVFLTLQHWTAGGDSAGGPSDQHSAAAALLCSFWEARGSGPDHRLEFASTGAAEPSPASQVITAQPQPALLCALMVAPRSLPPTAVWKHNQDPPGLPNSLLGCSVTVLLI